MASDPRRPLLAPADATRVRGLLPVQESIPPGLLSPQSTMTAAPEPGWWQQLMRRGAEWARRNNVPDPREFPPIRLLRAVMGDDPMANIEGPARAVAGFAAATRNRELMQRFADPGFHNFIIKHGPRQGHFSQLRDHAPEGVIEDLWQRYMATPEAKRAAARDAARRARESGAQRGRRRGDVHGR